jgi:putative oxidoreductase
MNTLLKLAQWKLNLIEKLAPLVDLLVRVQIASIFWKSGVLKLPAGFLGIGQGNWDSTLTLFKYEYNVPVLPPELAAYMSTTFELLCPVLLVLGFGARAGAFILLCMVGVIEFTYQSSPEHIYWALLLGMIFVRGAGFFSADYWIRKKFLPKA